MSVVIGFEAKSIQSWIVAGGRLRDIAGASEIIERLCTGDLHHALVSCKLAESRRRDHDGDRPTQKEEAGVVLSAAAGGFRLVIEDETRAREFLRLWPLVVAERAPGLRFALAAVPERDPADPRPAMDRLNDRLRATANLPQVDLPVAGPPVLRSQRTGLPAVTIDPRSDPGEQRQAIDAAAQRKQRVSNGMKAGEGLLERKFGRHTGPGFARETDVMEAAAPNAYLAYVHADANGLGKVFIRLHAALGHHRQGPELIAGISQAIGQITQTAAKEALNAALHGLNVELNELPARPVVLGGDDVTVILPGDRGLIFAETFLERFEQGTRSGLEDYRAAIRERTGLQPPDKKFPLPDRLTAAAGIAFVHSHYPARVAHDLSEGLCKFAKAPFRTDNGRQRSAIAFHRVTASAVDDYADILDRELTVRERWDPPLRLTMGPYVVLPGASGYADGDHPTIRALLDLKEVAQALPRGSWRELVTLCYEGPGAARHRFARILEVARKSDREETRKAADSLEQILIGLGCPAGTFWRDPQRKEDQPPDADLPPRLTPIPDVAALMGVERAVSRDDEQREAAA